MNAVSINLMQLEPDPRSSIAEFLADLFSFCSISYSCDFVDNFAADKIVLIEPYSETIVNLII